MYGDFIFIEQGRHEPMRWSRLELGQTGGRDEAWLRDLAHANPDILPIRDIDSAFGPLIPLCTELRTEAGPIDAAFISPDGKLTLVECKLWRNPEARRKVVAQALDYARVLTRWSYSDLQRQVSARLQRSGNVPYELVRERYPTVAEAAFIDATARTLRSGRFLLIILGDGIREDVEAIAELVNRNASSAFQLALVEAALYDGGEERLAVQMRVTARTRLIERTVFVAADTQTLPGALEDEAEGAAPSPSPRSPEIRKWWEPVLAMRFDDPDQPSPVYVNNYVRSQLPWPGLAVQAYRVVNGHETAVYLGGPVKARRAFFEALGSELESLVEDVPGVVVVQAPEKNEYYFWAPRRSTEFSSPDAHRVWIIETMNQFVNALRPRMKRLLAQSAV